jgi:hypothetical protein
LFERLKVLRESKEWNDEQQREYEKCDEQHIIGMITAEKKTKKIRTMAWSPTFGAAISKKAFWKIALTLKMTHTRPSDAYIIWSKAMGIDDFKALNIESIKQQLRAAQRNLKELSKKADVLREEHLRELIDQADEHSDDRSFQKRLQSIKKAHERQQHYKRIRSILKPTQNGGLSYILVPKDFNSNDYPYNPDAIQEWEPVHEQTELQDFLQKRNITHFGQAHGTPFTMEPLNKINWSADSIEAVEILNGSIPLSMVSNDAYTMKVLQYIANREKLPQIDTHLTPSQVSNGFKKWREDTSTSPSGCHLGLRRIPAFLTSDKEMENMRSEIQQLQADIINVPIQNGFSPSRWQTVINAMLEKIAGKPLLHKLRVIHILEADYNLALKMIFGRRLLQNCEQFETLGEHQDGFRKGRSTIRTLLQNEIVNDYNKRLRINNFVGMTDISGCFDRILPSIISMLNIKNGCPSEAVKMHADTLQKARYYLKTKNGISENFYSHTETTHVYGNGQGAGDSPSQWCQESAMLLDLYERNTSGSTMSFRDGTIAAKIPLAAFADDTNLLGNDDSRTKSIDQLVANTKKSFEVWNNLLHATGHFMELGKCACYLSIWDFEEDGYAFTVPPDKLQIQIEVNDINGGHQTIKQLSAETSQKLLGVMRNPIGNQQDELKRLQQKSDHIALRINSHSLSYTEAKMAYETFYIPALRYSLAITSLNQMDLERVQSKATIALLAASGYNRHMPREIVFAPKLYQGIGFKHLYDLQGCDATRLLLQEINTSGGTIKRCSVPYWKRYKWNPV